MKKSKVFIIVILVVIFLSVLTLLTYKPVNENKALEPQPVAKVTATSAQFSDGATTIEAMFNSDSTVTFNHSITGLVTLPIAVSGSGARYANSDQSLVFWEHQGEVTITKDGNQVFKGKIIKPEEVTKVLTEAEAREIAEKSCIKGGESISAGSYNENSKTWWFDANLNSTNKGCHPACVVSEDTKTSEINWRCTGAEIKN